MTTAHRPTWKAAVGRAQEGGWGAGGAVSTLSSVRDVASHTKLKLRAGPQEVDKRAALEESLRKLEEAEASRKRALLGGQGGGGRLSGFLTKGREANPEEEEKSRRKMLKATADVDDVGVRAKYDDADDDGDDGSDGDGGGGWSDLEDDDGGGAGGSGAGYDESDLDASDTDEDSSSDEDSDDEDEEAALQAELAKIRAEREAAKAKDEAEREEEERAKLKEAALTGNPLLSSSDGGVGTGKMKRRWNDDVVFRNQARDEQDRSGKRRFINDTVRNDFHRRFLNKFVR